MAQNDDVLKGRFMSRILREEGQNIEQAKLKAVSSFTSRNNFASQYTNDETKLVMRHPIALRFIDMKTRQTKEGKIRKKAHPVHNKIVMGHANNIVRRASFEYTSAMKETLLKDFPQTL
ncbi:MAG TPA: hypothetical protein PKH16_10020 [Aequorivita sp.]|nr:hypothetical protein [Aequorivita sp.]